MGGMFKLGVDKIGVVFRLVLRCFFAFSCWIGRNDGLALLSQRCTSMVSCYIGVLHGNRSGLRHETAGNGGEGMSL